MLQKVVTDVVTQGVLFVKTLKKVILFLEKLEENFLRSIII